LSASHTPRAHLAHASICPMCSSLARLPLPHAHIPVPYAPCTTPFAPRTPLFAPCTMHIPLCPMSSCLCFIQASPFSMHAEPLTYLPLHIARHPSHVARLPLPNEQLLSLCACFVYISLWILCASCSHYFVTCTLLAHLHRRVQHVFFTSQRPRFASFYL
jgi:hypothetical protein